MRLFFKHIFRSIKNSPLQPLIILITLTVSVAMFITSVRIAINIFKENIHHRGLDNYICDITIKPSAKDGMRFLFSNEIEKIVGSDGEVLGEFELTGLVNINDKSELVNICAADLKRADSFYNLRFVKYGTLTEQNLNNSIVISTDTAEYYGIDIGDTLPIHFLNYCFNLTVEAIALPDGILDDCEGIVNIGALSAVIADKNPSLAVGMENIAPYTSVKVKLNDKGRIDEFATLLSDNLDSQTVIKEEENVGAVDFANLLSTTMIIVSVVIVLVISVIVIATSLDLLNKKRIEESALFVICGAQTADLNRLIYLECLIYGALGALFGELLSLPFFELINKIFVWNTDDITFELYDILIAALISPLIILLTARIHTSNASSLTVSERMSREFNTGISVLSPKSLCALFGLVAALIATSYLIAPRYRFYSAVASILLIIVFIYFLSPYITEALSRTLTGLAKRLSKVPPKTVLALENIRNTHSLKHAVRLITVLLTLLFTIIPCLLVASTQSEIIETAIDCDYVSLAADKRAREVLSELEEVDSAFRIALIKGAVTDEGTAVLSISVADGALDAIHPKLAPKKLPQKDEIAISSGISIVSGKGVGDKITMIYETNSYDFVITEVINTSTNIVFLDVGYFGEDHDLLCIKAKENLSNEEYAKISGTLEIRGAAIVHKDKVFLPLTERILSFAGLILFVVILSIFSTVFGIINVFVTSHVYRKSEKNIYYTLGMTKRQILAYEFIEVLTILLFSALMIPVFSVITSHLLDISVNSFGVDMYF